MPDFPVIIRPNVSARIFITDWLLSKDEKRYWDFSPLKSFDEVFDSSSCWISAYSNEGSIKITFDKPEVVLSI